MTELARKLGLKAGARCRMWQVPDHVAGALAGALEGAVPGDPPDWLIGVCEGSTDVARAAVDLVPAYPRGGHLWLAYPKRASGMVTDLTRDRGWAPVLALDLLPVTQVAVDDTWSALRWRHRDEIARLTRSFVKT